MSGGCLQDLSSLLWWQHSRQVSHAALDRNYLSTAHRTQRHSRARPVLYFKWLQNLRPAFMSRYFAMNICQLKIKTLLKYLNPTYYSWSELSNIICISIRIFKVNDGCWELRLSFLCRYKRNSSYPPHGFPIRNGQSQSDQRTQIRWLLKFPLGLGRNKWKHESWFKLLSQIWNELEGNPKPQQ